jgi:radical S-adenosyl methionine domain-containing protein 2
MRSISVNGQSGRIVPLVINWHVTKACNYSCRYCYAKWQEPKHAGKKIHESSWRDGLLQEIHAFFQSGGLFERRSGLSVGSVRLNLAGGEPLIEPELALSILDQSHKIGMDTSIITNGSLLTEDLVQKLACRISLLGVSVDSSLDACNRDIGRAGRNGKTMSAVHLRHLLGLARNINPGLRVKINTVVHSLNWDEDISSLILALTPERWKILKMLPVVSNDLAVSDQNFRSFVERHRKLPVAICAESNEEMTESYVMIDPAGRFFQNSSGGVGYCYSRPIMDVGAAEAWKDIAWRPEKFSSRYRAQSESAV